MFNLICDIAWFKRNAIANELVKKGDITRDILIGIGPNRVADEFVTSATTSVTECIESALRRQYKRVRVYAVCNGLTDLVKEIASKSVGSLAGEAARHLMRETGQCTMKNGARIEFFDVPSSVTKGIAKLQTVDPVLVIGTEGVNEIYEKCLSEAGLQRFKLSRADYRLIDDAIVAAIGQNRDEIRRVRDEISLQFVEPFRSRFRAGVVVEACTDFDFGLGVNSLKAFAEEMVLDVYT